jgi:hypothetical protein
MGKEQVVKRFAVLAVVLVTAAAPCSAQAAIKKTVVSGKAWRFASDLCAVSHGPNYEPEPCPVEAVPIALVGFQVSVSKPEVVGISGRLKAKFRPKVGSVPLKVGVSVDGTAMKAPRRIVVRPKVSAFYVLEVTSSGLKALSGKLPIWAS